ncbi:MAG: hypothetical protein Q4E53_06135 [Eubacteriales bacterium]|nr:hypothetical protein [Eubacteriales bacterium]
MRKFTFFYSIIAALFGIDCVVFAAAFYIRAACAVLVFVAIMLILKYGKCTACGKYGVSLNPFSKKFGTCKHCGNDLES